MNLILASASPRRAALLEQIGIAYRIVPADIDESVRHGESPVQTVVRLAAEKAAAVAARFPDAVVLAADTVGVLDGVLLGKPQDRGDAERMLRQMMGRTHEVVTAFCVRQGTRRVLESVSARVRMVAHDEALLQSYLDTGEGLDKAGAYAVQGRGAVLVEEIAGDFYAVVGLPVTRLCATLRDFAIFPFSAAHKD